jgi:hypothetical protein
MKLAHRLGVRGQRAASQSDALLLLDPGIGQGIGEAGDREVRGRGAIDDRRNDAGRQEGERSHQADVPFALGLTLSIAEFGTASASCVERCFPATQGDHHDLTCMDRHALDVLEEIREHRWREFCFAFLQIRAQAFTQNETKKEMEIEHERLSASPRSDART